MEHKRLLKNWNKLVCFKFEQLYLELSPCTLTEGCNLWPTVASAMSVNQKYFPYILPTVFEVRYLFTQNWLEFAQFYGIRGFILLQRYRTLHGISSWLNIIWGKFIIQNVCSAQFVVKEKIQTRSLVFHLTQEKMLFGSKSNIWY